MNWFLDGEVWRAVSERASWHIGEVDGGFKLLQTMPNSGDGEVWVRSADDPLSGLFESIEAAKAAAEFEDARL